MKPITTLTDLITLMSQHKAHTATLKFYDMADRYILRMGDWHLDFSDAAANQLLDALAEADTENVTITIVNNRRAAKIQAN
ncbi:phosphate acetyltransferase [Leuconostoc lactis]|uniref:phosphate acetyltransferase n=1 Tax=Leuconostoc lactis TaxID=1246 RepID=UPI001C1F7C64|nr:phosphate acetyltransferase [Leuconostoc lactis]MBU7537972.1 phosphate acetyltransferase [Leuconostoc lactis]